MVKMAPMTVARRNKINTFMVVQPKTFTRSMGTLAHVGSHSLVELFIFCLFVCVVRGFVQTVRLRNIPLRKENQCYYDLCVAMGLVQPLHLRDTYMRNECQCYYDSYLCSINWRILHVSYFRNVCKTDMSCFCLHIRSRHYGMKQYSLCIHKETNTTIIYYSSVYQYIIAPLCLWIVSLMDSSGPSKYKRFRSDGHIYIDRMKSTDPDMKREHDKEYNMNTKSDNPLGSVTCSNRYHIVLHIGLLLAISRQCCYSYHAIVTYVFCGNVCIILMCNLYSYYYSSVLVYILGGVRHSCTTTCCPDHRCEETPISDAIDQSSCTYITRGNGSGTNTTLCHNMKTCTGDWSYQADPWEFIACDIRTAATMLLCDNGHRWYNTMLFFRADVNMYIVFCEIYMIESELYSKHHGRVSFE